MRIHIVGIGGTIRPASSTECALRCALRAAEAEGASVECFGGEELVALPHYGAVSVGGEAAAHGAKVAQAMIAALRRADGVIIASPGYHGSVSGLVKNALDYIEELARDTRPYLDGLPVGLITTAYGGQAAMSALASLRMIAHALRGWPTPYGAAITTSAKLFAADGSCTDPATDTALTRIGQQTVFGAQRLRGV
jgi:FMN reductase